MNVNQLQRLSVKPARTGITFLDQDPAGGQKVISGSYYEPCQQRNHQALFSRTQNLKSRYFWSKEWGVQYYKSIKIYQWF